MSLGKTCSACGAALDASTPEGHCPQCLFNLALKSEAALGTCEAPGTRIGRYNLLEKVGIGGMGNVWLAEQTEPFHRKVAIKVIKPGMDSAEVLARFEAERQALALMDHPNIAKVLDAGAIPGGRPYFVMELVKGTPITGFCDEHRLSVPERLNLFRLVCQAVQHAHHKGIIHRDLKPSNVLVTLSDGKPVPKVIDFGIAKAIGPRLTEHSLHTLEGELLGTPEYMSPEQAHLNSLDIDTRSDIYSLGVLLYELLTGSTPLTRETAHQTAFDEVLRMIREQDPPKPSQRLTKSGAKLTTISTHRKLEPGKLTKLVRGELDWIVMMALEKDRNRRYETANGLARDIERYLNNEPVMAVPPTVRYRVKKFIHKHRGPVAAAAAFVGTLVGCLVIVLVVLAHNRRILGGVKDDWIKQLDIWNPVTEPIKTLDSTQLALFNGKVPKDPKAGQTPLTLTFAVYKWTKPSKMLEIMAPVLGDLEDDMQKDLGRPVRISFHIYRTYDDAQNALVSNEVQFMRMGASSYVELREKYTNLVILQCQNGQPRGYLFTRQDSGIQKLQDLRGKKIAFVEDSSTTGNYLPKYELLLAGITAQDFADRGTNYLGSHEAVVEAVIHKQADAGACNASIVDALKTKNELHIIKEFKEKRGQPWVACPSLDLQVAESIRKGLRAINDAKNLTPLGNKTTAFIDAADADFDELRKAMRKAKQFDAQP